MRGHIGGVFFILRNLYMLKNVWLTPTLFCLKKTGKPSSKNMSNATIKKSGESNRSMMSESNLFNIVDLLIVGTRYFFYSFDSQQ